MRTVNLIVLTAALALPAAGAIATTNQTPGFDWSGHNTLTNSAALSAGDRGTYLAELSKQEREFPINGPRKQKHRYSRS